MLDNQSLFQLSFIPSPLFIYTASNSSWSYCFNLPSGGITNGLAFERASLLSHIPAAPKRIFFVALVFLNSSGRQSWPYLTNSLLTLPLSAPRILKSSAQIRTTQWDTISINQTKTSTKRYPQDQRVVALSYISIFLWQSMMLRSIRPALVIEKVWGQPRTCLNKQTIRENCLVQLRFSVQFLGNKQIHTTQNQKKNIKASKSFPVPQILSTYLPEFLLIYVPV